MHERLLLLYLPFIVVVGLTFPTTADDPFITLRYAANLVHGLGAVYNPGQRVEGFTSPLHLAVAVFAYVTPGGHAIVKLKLASLLFGTLALREGSILLAGLRPPAWARRVGLVALGSSVTLALASVNALETSLEIWLLMALLRRLVTQRPSQYGLVPTVVAFFLVLARFDSLVPMVMMALAGLWIHRGTLWWRRSSWIAGAGVSAVLAMVGQYWYYGFPFPNTYYAKLQGGRHAIHEGLHYVTVSIVPGGGLPGLKGLLAILFVSTGFILVALGVVGAFRRTTQCLYAVALVFGQVLFILKAGGDWMVGGRFFAPAVIPLVAIEVLGLVEVGSLLQARSGAATVRSVQAVASASLVGASFLPFTGLMNPVWQMTGVDDRAVIADGHFPLGSSLWAALPGALHCLKSGQLVATTEEGYLGFARQDLRILDMRGLTDQDIAHSSPAQVFKNSQGVTDLYWPSAKSPVGREILRAHPSAIATFDWPFGLQQSIGESVLGGRYRLLDRLSLGGGSIGVFGTPSVDQACFADAGQLDAAIHRDLTASRFDGLMKIEVGGRFQLRYLEFDGPDRALLRRSRLGRPTEIDIAGSRFVASPGTSSTYSESPIVEGAPSLADLPKAAMQLLSSGLPSRDTGHRFVIQTTAPIPPFLHDVAGSGPAPMTITATAYNYLNSESLRIVEPGRVVNVTLWFYNFNRVPPIGRPG